MLKLLRGGVVWEINVWEDVIKWTSSPHFWYLFMLMFWTVLSPVLYLAYRDKRALILLGLSQALYLLYMGNDVLHSRFIYILYTWGGLLGSRVPDLLDRICSWDRNKKIIVSSVSWTVYFGLYLLYAGRNFPMGIQVWLYGLRAVAFLLGAINLPLLKIGQITKYRYSFWLFAVHFWLDSYVSASLGSVFAFNAVLGQLVTWCIVVMVGLGTGILMNKWFIKAFNILTGNRAVS